MPPQVLFRPFGVATTSPAGRLSVKATPASATVFAAGFVIVMVSVLTPFSGMPDGLNFLAIDGGATTTNASAVDSGGNLWLAGRTGPGFPVVNASQPQIGGATDGFLAEFDESGTLLSSTYLGGSGDDRIDSLVPQNDGSVIVFGTTSSSDFPVTQASPFGSGTLFIARLRSGTPPSLAGLAAHPTKGSGLF